MTHRTHNLLIAPGVAIIDHKFVIGGRVVSMEISAFMHTARIVYDLHPLASVDRVIDG